ncbi:hypothetical protein L0F63_007432, partial [Massospora cicadina]
VKPIQEALDKKKLMRKILPGENMTLKPTSFGSRCELTEKFQAGVLKLGIINILTILSQAKENMAIMKALDSTKSGRNSGILKLEEANKVGTQESDKCTLILTEGDSTKALVMAGLDKVGWDYYGMFPFHGN